MSTCVHIIQTQLCQDRAEQLLQALSATDVIVVSTVHTRTLDALRSNDTNPVYILSASESDLAPHNDRTRHLSYADFVALLAACTHSRTW